MIPQTPERPEKRRDTYYSTGVSPTVDPKERTAGLHESDSLAAQAVLELDPFLATPELRQTLWYRAFYRQVLTGLSILYPHVNAHGKAKMAQEYTDDLVYGGYLRALQSLTVSRGLKHTSFAQEFATSQGIPVKTSRQEMYRFCAACRALLAVLLPLCWILAKWCLYHCLRLLLRTVTGLCRIITSLLRRRRLILEDREFFTSNRATDERTAYCKRRQRRKNNPPLAVRRFRRR
jgi:hypothetical protein